MSTLVRLLARTAELGPLSLADLVAAVPVVVPAATPLGLTGVSGAAGLAAVLQVAAGSLTRPDGVAEAVRDWLLALASSEVRATLAEHGVDLAAALEAARATGGDILIAATEAVRRALSGDMTQAAVVFPASAVATVARALAGNLPVYLAIRDAAVAYAAGSDPLVGLRAVLRVGTV